MTMSCQAGWPEQSCQGCDDGDCPLMPEVLVEAPDDVSYQDAYEWKRVER